MMKLVVLALIATSIYFCLADDPNVIHVKVIDKECCDYRSSEVYTIIFTYGWENGTSLNGTVHRQYAEFVQLDTILREDYFYETIPQLPSDSEGVSGMNSYLLGISESATLFQSADFLDFLGIRFSFCDGIKWFQSLESLLYIQYVAELPAFVPEPPKITYDNFFDVPETPFECYMLLAAFKDGITDLPWVVGLIENYTTMNPAWNGSDVDSLFPPGVTTPFETPSWYVNMPVHFQPGGYVNGKNIRISYLARNKYNFLKEDLLKEWIPKIHGNSTPARILDMGSGYGTTSFVFGELFPEAEVIGIDMAAPNVRFTREWKARRGAPNVEFYYWDARQTPFEDGYFDIVHFTYVLHEMPANASSAILAEAYRLLRPGGVLSGFEVPYESDPVQRIAYIEFNTWGWLGDHDYSKYGFHGPEPFMYEYEDGLQLPTAMTSVGFVNETVIPYSVFDFIIWASKP